MDTLGDDDLSRRAPHVVVNAPLTPLSALRRKRAVGVCLHQRLWQQPVAREELSPVNSFALYVLWGARCREARERGEKEKRERDEGALAGERAMALRNVIPSRGQSGGPLGTIHMSRDKWSALGGLLSKLAWRWSHFVVESIW